MQSAGILATPRHTRQRSASLDPSAFTMGFPAMMGAGRHINPTTTPSSSSAKPSRSADESVRNSFHNKTVLLNARRNSHSNGYYLDLQLLQRERSSSSSSSSSMTDALQNAEKSNLNSANNSARGSFRDSYLVSILNTSSPSGGDPLVGMLSTGTSRNTQSRWSVDSRPTGPRRANTFSISSQQQLQNYIFLAGQSNLPSGETSTTGSLRNSGALEALKGGMGMGEKRPRSWMPGQMGGRSRGGTVERDLVELAELSNFLVSREGSGVNSVRSSATGPAEGVEGAAYTYQSLRGSSGGSSIVFGNGIASAGPRSRGSLGPMGAPGSRRTSRSLSVQQRMMEGDDSIPRMFTRIRTGSSPPEMEMEMDPSADSITSIFEHPHYEPTSLAMGMTAGIFSSTSPRPSNSRPEPVVIDDCAQKVSPSSATTTPTTITTTTTTTVPVPTRLEHKPSTPIPTQTPPPANHNSKSHSWRLFSSLENELRRSISSMKIFQVQVRAEEAVGRRNSSVWQRGEKGGTEGLQRRWSVGRKAADVEKLQVQRDGEGFFRVKRRS